MSLKQELDQLLSDIPEVESWQVDKDVLYHGQKATSVDVTLTDGSIITGVFTDTNSVIFGGVAGSGNKDIAGLIKHKVISVIEGSAER